MSVTSTAMLPVRDEAVDSLAGLLTVERARRGTRAQTRSLSVHDQAVLVLRWFWDGARMSQLARDNAIGDSTAYDYLHEGIDVLAARASSLHGALLALATAAGDLRSLGDLGYEGESDIISVAFKKPEDAHLTNEQQQLNKAHNSLRAVGERGNALLKMTFTALRNVSIDPWRIKTINVAC